MTTREVPTSASVGPVTGPALLDIYAARFESLFNSIGLAPSVVTNSGNDYTLTVDPELTADVVQPMLFYVKPNASNTGAARLRITSANPYYDWVKSNGDDFASGELDSSTVYGVVFFGGEFRTLTQSATGDVLSAVLDSQVFVASGTWTKPLDLDGDSLVFVELWGGGGASSNSGSSGAGGGGGYNFKWFLASELGATETVTIGAGGATGTDPTDGGDSSFGAFFSAFGGGAGQDSAGDTGGGGGGQLSGGSQGGGVTGGNGGRPSQGLGGDTTTNTNGGHGNSGGGADSGTANIGGGGIFGGGGGAGFTTTSTGGDSLYGGAGGGRSTGGTSVFGGNGGTLQVAGTAPGGGGGCSGAVGARGECRVRVIGAASA